MSALLKEQQGTDENDYILSEKEQSVWITVDNISVHIIRTDEGVVVDLYPLGLEMEGSIAGCYAFKAEAAEAIEAHNAAQEPQHRKTPQNNE